MHNPASYYPAPRNEDLKGWLRSGRAANSSEGSSNSHSYADDEDLPSPLLEIDEEIAGVLQCVWTASSSSTTDSDPFASRVSIPSATASVVVELPEIPFVTLSVTDDEEIDDAASSIWLRRRPAASTTSSERQIAILGQTSERVLGHCRQRSGSITSTASRPAPAKSILSSSSSIRTRKGRAPPSVKFLDMPTIHFEDEDEDGHYQPEPTYEPRRMKSNASFKGKKRGLGFLDWFASPNKKPKAAAPDRPLISGPLPLWEGRRCSSESERSPYRCTSPTSARSIRSVKSTSSMRSARSCASRLQGYWTRLSGRDS